MNLKPLADVLTARGLGVQGETLFISMLPVGKNGLLLRDKLTGTPVDHELPGYYKTSFQLIARSPDMEEGLQLISNAVTALTLVEADLGVMLMRYSRPQALPAVFPLSDGNLFEFNVWFDVAFNV